MHHQKKRFCRMSLSEHMNCEDPPYFEKVSIVWKIYHRSGNIQIFCFRSFQLYWNWSLPNVLKTFFIVDWPSAIRSFTVFWKSWERVVLTIKPQRSIIIRFTQILFQLTLFAGQGLCKYHSSSENTWHPMVTELLLRRLLIGKLNLASCDY